MDVDDDGLVSIGLPPWTSLVQTWRPLYDEIGIDSYPNRVGALPLRTDVLAAQIANASRASAVGGMDSAPVWVTETSYPVLENSSIPHPSVIDFTEQNQADYMKAAVIAANNAGG